jgi:hypothetical protein
MYNYPAAKGSTKINCSGYGLVRSMKMKRLTAVDKVPRE